MFCPNCGKKLQPNSKFCSHCGQSTYKTTEITVEQNNTKPQNSGGHNVLNALGFIILYIIIGGIIMSIVGSAPGMTSREQGGVDFFILLIIFFLAIVSIAATNKRQNKESPAVKIRMTEGGGNVVQENAVTGKQSGEKPKTSSGMKVLIIVCIFLIIGALFSYFGFQSTSIQTPPLEVLFLPIAVIVVLLLGWRFRQSIFRLIKYLFHRPKLGIPALIFSIILLLFGIWAFHDMEYNSAAKALPVIQDSLSEVAAAKLMGDSIMTGGVVPSGIWMSKIKQIASDSSENLTRIYSPALLTDYKKSAISWISTISDAAANTSIWKDLPEQPTDFDLSLNDTKAKEYLETSVKKLSELKNYGDAAIKRQDRKTMYYIAAKILVQEHWLNGIIYSTNPGFLGSNRTVLNVYAAPARTIRPSVRHCDPGPCHNTTPRKICISYSTYSSCGSEILASADEIYKAAIAYSKGSYKAEDTWSSSWNDAPPLVPNISAGQPIDTTGGVTQGEANQGQAVPQFFVDDCRAKGGIVGGTGGVKTRLPTTESGYNCDYKNGSTSCWDLLTYSGGRYMGGDNGCPEQNLLPPPRPTPEPTRPPQEPRNNPPVNNGDGSNNQPQPQPQNDSWDGTYRIHDTGGNCGANAAGYSVSQAVQSSLYNLSVSGNRITLPYFGTTTIDSSGNAQLNYGLNYGGAVINMTQTFHFAHSGSGVVVQGTMRVSAGGAGYGVVAACSTNFSGSRL